MRLILKTLVLVLGIFSAAAFGWSQAIVPEYLETATLYVDVVSGSDSNPGTQSLPLKTIGKAASLAETNNRAGVGTKVIINPGTYRESITVSSTGKDTTLPITFQAASTATISGADVWTGWRTYSGNANIFTNSWPYQWGLCALDTGSAPFEQDIVRRREMIFVNGTSLTQVLSLSAMVQGTFFADESGATVYIWPPNGTNIGAATVEVSTRPSLFSIAGKSDVVLRGLTFQYANSCRRDEAVHVYGSSNNILFDTDTFVWNNAAALTLAHPTANITVQNSVANHNGQAGLHSYQLKNALWSSNQVLYNNWRGSQGAYYAWGAGGANFFSDHNETITGLTSAYNQTHGLHWDTDNVAITASGLVLTNNLLAGALVEKNEGPITISDSFICNNDNPQALSSEAGLALRNSSYVTLTADTFSNNGVNQIIVVGQKGGISITNWETGQTYLLFTQNLTQTQDTVIGDQSQNVFRDSYLSGSDWTIFQTTLVSNNNTWWNASSTKAFTVPMPKAGTNVDFSGWQSDTGQDQNSVFAAPSGNPAAACQITPDQSDYWFITTTASVNVTAGKPAAFSVTVVPLAFNGNVQLSSDGLQNISGATGSWSPASINTSGSATFTVNTQSTTPKGTFPLTLIANSGSLTRTATVSLVVQ